MKECTHCWNPINWCESFDKHGHGDGDDCVHTQQVASSLRAAGFEVDVHDDTLHNPVITEIRKAGAAGLAVIYNDSTPGGNILADINPRNALPAEIVALLDQTFGRGEVY